MKLNTEITKQLGGYLTANTDKGNIAYHSDGDAVVLAYKVLLFLAVENDNCYAIAYSIFLTRNKTLQGW